LRLFRDWGFEIRDYPEQLYHNLIPLGGHGCLHGKFISHFLRENLGRSLLALHHKHLPQAKAHRPEPFQKLGLIGMRGVPPDGFNFATDSRGNGPVMTFLIPRFPPIPPTTWPSPTMNVIAQCFVRSSLVNIMLTNDAIVPVRIR